MLSVGPTYMAGECNLGWGGGARVRGHFCQLKGPTQPPMIWEEPEEPGL